jgi:hypothetical protein
LLLRCNKIILIIDITIAPQMSIVNPNPKIKIEALIYPKVHTEYF